MAVISRHQASGRGPGPSDGPGGLATACAVNAAWNALTYVRDPGLRLDVVSLGLIYDVRAENGVIVVELGLTRPGSPARKALPGRVRAAVAGAVGEAAAVDVRLVRDPPWNPGMIDLIAAAAAGLRSADRDTQASARYQEAPADGGGQEGSGDE